MFLTQPSTNPYLCERANLNKSERGMTQWFSAQLPVFTARPQHPQRNCWPKWILSTYFLSLPSLPFNMFTFMVPFGHFDVGIGTSRQCWLPPTPPGIAYKLSCQQFNHIAAYNLHTLNILWKQTFQPTANISCSFITMPGLCTARIRLVWRRTGHAYLLVFKNMLVGCHSSSVIVFAATTYCAQQSLNLDRLWVSGKIHSTQIIITNDCHSNKLF